MASSTVTPSHSICAMSKKRNRKKKKQKQKIRMDHPNVTVHVIIVVICPIKRGSESQFAHIQTSDRAFFFKNCNA